MLSAVVGSSIGSLRMTLSSCVFFALQKVSAVAHARELSRERVLRHQPSRRRYLADEQFSR